MSTPTGLATVTATLRQLLSGVTTDVTTMAPSAARGGRNGDQLNIFLFGVYCSPALTNSPPPNSRPGDENAYPRLSLVLKYLITAYGANDDDISGQQLMGQTMSILHNHPVLERSDIEDVTADSNLQNQVEGIRITPAPLTRGDMCELGTIFRPAEYRLSTVYEVSVVLVDSARSDSVSLAALKHGTNAPVRPSSSSPDSTEFVKQQPAGPEHAAVVSDELAADNFSGVRSEPPQKDELIEIPRRTGPVSAELDRFTRRIDAKAEWDDLVLPPEQIALLKQIADQVALRDQVYKAWGFREKMTRAFGISALFAGESGTGKTMAAEVIANVLELDLYRIDLPAVVSKYIGETEKNLRRLFNAAQDREIILFFDEADALFGKRSEVKDSHDRYANIETGYLLQRMESYRGLAILATNLKSSVDTAFVRRLRFVVDFPRPDATLREEIWRKVFPRLTPVHGDLDYQRLAELELTGGSIQNVALEAAFGAAQQGSPVTMPLILAAATTELKKLER